MFVSLRSVSPGTTRVLCSDSSGQSPGLAGQGGLQERAGVLPPEHLLQQHVQHGRSHHRDVYPKLLQTSRHFREDLKKAKKHYVRDTLSRDLDVRARWVGLKSLKKGYAPRPFETKQNGTHY